jgi:hypothetical protein
MEAKAFLLVSVFLFLAKIANSDHRKATFLEIPCSDETSTAKAVAEIIENVFVNRSINFDFILYHGSLGSLADKVAKSVNRVTRIIKIKNPTETLPVEQSAVLFFDSPKHYKNFHNKALLANQYPKELYFFVYIANYKKEDLAKAWPISQALKINRQVYFLCDNKEKDYIDLRTHMFFNKYNCRKFKNSRVNQFSKISKKWRNQNFTKQKFKNFNGCELVVKRDEPFEPFAIEIHDIIFSTLQPSGPLNNFTTEEVPQDFELDTKSMRNSVENNKKIEKVATTHHIYVL